MRGGWPSKQAARGVETGEREALGGMGAHPQRRRCRQHLAVALQAHTAGRAPVNVGYSGFPGFGVDAAHVALQVVLCVCAACVRVLAPTECTGLNEPGSSSRAVAAPSCTAPAAPSWITRTSLAYSASSASVTWGGSSILRVKQVWQVALMVQGRRRKVKCQGCVVV